MPPKSNILIPVAHPDNGGSMPESPSPLQLSPEAIETFRACPYSFARRYIENLPPSSVAAPHIVLDGLVHRTLGEFFRRGGWSVLGEEEVLRLLAEMTGTAGGRRRVPTAITTVAEDLVRAFVKRPYPLTVVRELACERTITWRHFRHGMLATAVADRVCQLDDGAIEVIDYRTEDAHITARSTKQDTKALFLRSLAAASAIGLAGLIRPIAPPAADSGASARSLRAA